MYTGEVIYVTARCHNTLLREILKKFGKSTRISKVDDSHFSIGVKVTDNDGLYRWLMQYGRLIYVTSPEYVREKIKQLLLDAAKNYEV